MPEETPRPAMEAYDPETGRLRPLTVEGLIAALEAFPRHCRVVAETWSGDLYPIVEAVEGDPDEDMLLVLAEAPLGEEGN